MDNTNGDVSKRDNFEIARESLWNLPGFQRRNSTIISTGWSFLPQSTWIIETIKTDDNFAIFLQCVNRDGGQRMVIPQKVCQAIYAHQSSIMKTRRKVRAKRAAETRKRKQELSS